MGPLLAEFRQHYGLVLIESASLRLPRGRAAGGLLRRRLPGGAAGLDHAAGIREAAAAIEQCQGRLRGCIAVD